MRHPTSWADLAGARVGVWGLGTEGLASLRRLRTMGLEPVLVDDTPGSGSGALATSAGGLDALLGCEVVLKTPGISRYRDDVQAVRAAGVEVVSGLGLWLAAADRDRVACITGTKGKSTTTAMAEHLARGLGVRVFAGGNLGVPPFDPGASDDADLWLIETSSYQAADLEVSPGVVAVTSLHPDHLPWHGDLDTYERDKLSLCTRPGERVVIANGTSDRLRDRAELLGPVVQWAGEAGPWADGLAVAGAHNRVNAEIARLVLAALGVEGADLDGAGGDGRLARAAEGFRGLACRLEHVGTIDEVDWYDDTLSTNVLPTLAAVHAFPDRRVAVIVGGLDRQIDYTALAEGLGQRGAATLVLAGYQTGPRIVEVLEAASLPDVEVTTYVDLPDAVARAAAWAGPGTVVLLSPAAASFDAFVDYRDKSRQFRAAITAATGMVVEGAA